MTNDDPNHPWNVLPEKQAGELSSLVGQLGSDEKPEVTINDIADLMADYARERFHTGVREGNLSVLGRNGMALSNWLPKAFEAIWSHGPGLELGWSTHNAWLWASLKELERVVSNARSLRAFTPPTIEDFLAQVQSLHYRGYPGVKS